MSSHKKKSIFSDVELEAMRLADEEIEKQFSLSREEIEFSRRMDHQAKLDRLEDNERKIAARRAAYYQANKDKCAAYQAAYYRANKDKRADYQREYRRRKKLLALQEQEKAALGVQTENGKVEP